MKFRMTIAAVMVLILLCGCAPVADPTAPTVTPTVTPTANPTTAPTTKPTTAPTAPPAPTGEATEPNNFNAAFPWGYFDQITVYPFSEDELNAAMDLLNTKLATTSDKEDVVSYETHWISFDPYGTLVSIKDQIQNNPVDGWRESDYYAHKALFVVCFSVDVDEAKSTGADYTEQLGTVTLTRASVDGEWTIDVDACSPETICEASSMMIPASVISNVHRSEKFAMAGYHDEAVGEYLIYVLDAEKNNVLCWSYYAAKPN